MIVHAFQASIDEAHHYGMVVQTLAILFGHASIQYDEVTQRILFYYYSKFYDELCLHELSLVSSYETLAAHILP